MKRALRMVALHYKVVLRSAHPLMLVIGLLLALFLPAQIHSLFYKVGMTSMHPLSLVPLLTGGLDLLFLMLLSASFGAAFSHLYLSKDLPLLLASPVRPREVILSKVIEVSLTASVPLLIAGVPMLTGIAASWYALPWFYLLAVMSVIPFMILPALLAILLNLVMSRLVPEYRARELLAATSTLLGAFVYLLMRVAGSSVGPSIMREGFSAFFGRFGPSWSPATLLARALAEGLLDKPLPPVTAILVLAGASVAGFALIVPWTERAYVSGWAAYGEARGVKRQAGYGSRRGEPGDQLTETAAAGDVDAASSALPQPRRPFLATEILSFQVEARLLFRDLQAQAQALYIMAMMLGVILFPGRGSSTLSDSSAYAIVFFFLAMGGTYSSWSIRNALTTQKILRPAPCDPARVMRGKAVFYGAVQVVCLSVMITALIVAGRFSSPPGAAFFFIILWLSLSTAAVSISVASSDPQIAGTTGIPRLGFGSGLVLFLINGLLALTGVWAWWVIPRSAGRSYVEAAFYMALFIGVQIFAFATATNMTRNHVLPLEDKDGGAATR